MTDLVEELGGLIISPSETLERVLKKKELKSAFIVVSLGGVLGGIWISTTFPITAPELMDLIPIGFAGWIVSGLILTLLSWVIGAGIFRLVAKVLGGKGEYNKVLQLTGYAHMPYLLAYSLGMMTFFVSPMLADVVGVIGSLWALILTIFAISIAEGFSKLRAVVTVVIATMAVVVLMVGVIVIMAGLAVMPLASMQVVYWTN